MTAADGTAAFLLTKIDKFISREWSLLSSIGGGIEELKSELGMIRGCLREAENVDDSNEQNKEWIKLLRQLAYEIEVVQDMFDLHAAQKFSLSPNFVPKLIRRRRAIGKTIQEIKTKIPRVKDPAERYQPSDQARPSQTSRHRMSSVYTNNHHRVDALYETDVVGIEKPRNELISWVQEEGQGQQQKLKVKFVVGMVGLGKTLMVHQAYRSAVEGFNCYAWIQVSRSHNAEELLRITVDKLSIPSMGSSVAEQGNCSDLHQLIDKVRRRLQGRSYMIVFDDLWSKDVWESIKNAFPSENYGRIIITSRRSDIAHLCSRDDRTFSVYNLEPLPSMKSQELFHKKVFPPDAECPSRLVDLSRKFLKQCEGLPLGIKTIGELLAKEEQTADAWRQLHDSLGSLMNSNGPLSSITKLLSVSYFDLPHHLRYCFLYFSIFPEDYSIKRRKLIRLWLSEGLLQQVPGKIPEEVGEDNLKELIQRNLVLVNEADFNGRAKTCRVHRLLHKIILSMAQEANFCSVFTESNSNLNEKVRRLSIISKSCNGMSEMEFPCARSFFMFRVEEKLSNSTLSGFSILKALDLEGANLDKFPDAIIVLVLLGYLSLRKTKIRKLPRSIKKLQNLETLDLKQTHVTEVPKIFKLTKLRHLLVCQTINNNVTIDTVQGFRASAKIGRLITLQKLSFIKANGDSGMIQELQKLTALRKLGITDLKENDGKHLSHSIEKMKKLQTLDVSSSSEEEHLDLNAICDPPEFLQRLYLKGRLHKLPDWVSSLHDLIRIRLTWSKLSSSPISALQDLPNLMELQLFDAYTGNELVFCTGKFQKLKILDLQNLVELKFIAFQKDAVGSLQTIKICRCTEMKTVPRGIDKLKLRDFLLYEMPEELENQRKKYGERFRHIPNICSYVLDSAGNWMPRG